MTAARTNPWASLLHHARANARIHKWRWYIVVDATDPHRYATCRGVFDVRDLPGASPLELTSKHGLMHARQQGKRLLGRCRVRAYVRWLRDLAREAEGRAA